MEILSETESFLTAAFLWCMSKTSCDRDNSRRMNTRKELGRCVCRLGTMIQSIFCAQSGAGIHLNFWKWSGESRYPGALPPLLENFRPAFSPDRLTAPAGSPRMADSLPAHNDVKYRLS